MKNVQLPQRKEPIDTQGGPEEQLNIIADNGIQQ